MTAPPVDGVANTAVCEFLARALSISKSRVRLVSGSLGRNKQIEIIGLSADDARTLLATGKSA